ncbi:alpha/beta hydrolase fold-domain-containing protein [Hysterangium stoloniferum]|nr:alpha/beta hydrolase fold-domain-containing protein [Hysterangium stoloniferum]KAF8493809.1 alpha/beta hydrolase fold-domain-containing protein [Hysterangium stoloniferum]
MSQYAYLSEPDPKWAEVASRVPPTELPKDFAQYRRGLAEAVGRSLSRRPLGECIFKLPLGPKTFININYPLNCKGIHLNLTARQWVLPVDGTATSIRTYVPDSNTILGEDQQDRYPALVWIFGGGWCSGTLDNADTLLRSLSVDLRISCVAVDYRKAPEHPFPTPLNDAYASLKWVVENAQLISIDVHRGLIVGGISTGGNLAAAMVQRAMNDPDLRGKITGQVLVTPALLSASAYPVKFKDELLSLEQNSDASILSGELIRLFWETYHGPHASNPEVSPLLAASFEGLPRTYIQINGMDPLRDEAILYNKLLREAGVPTMVDMYPGFPHGFHEHFPDLTASRRQSRQLHTGIVWLLRGGCVT